MDLQLRYFRFMTDNLDLTYEFWTVVMRMQRESQTDIGTKVRCCLAFPSDSVGLRFEFDCVHGKTKYYSFNKEDSAEALAKARHDSLPKSPKSDVSILVHVHSVEDTVAKCKSKGFVIYLEPMKTTESAIMAVLLDPSGIKVRIIEDSFHFPVNPQKSPGTLAYLSIPIKHTELVQKAIRFYDIAQQKIDGYLRRGADELIVKRPGIFTQVDSEHFIEGLTAYNWLGNGDRSSNTTLCLISRRALTSTVSTSETESMSVNSRSSKKLFLGLSFFVQDLEMGKQQLMAASPGSSFHIQTIPGFPRFIYLFDPSFVPVEVTDDVATHGFA